MELSDEQKKKLIEACSDEYTTKEQLIQILGDTENIHQDFVTKMRSFAERHYMKNKK